MFRTINKPAKCLFRTTRHYCESSPTKAKDFDFNRVVLCGTVVSHKIHEPSGTNVVLLQTRNEHTKQIDIHTVNTHIKFDVEEGQRLLCKGRVHSGRFVTEDGNNRLRLINSSYFTRPVHQNCTDINFVEMYGNIASNVFKRLASTHFTLVSHLRPKAGADLVPQFFHIFIRDERLMPLASQLEKTHRVYLSGSIQYEDVKNETGRAKQQGSILVNQLCKGASTSYSDVTFEPFEAKASPSFE